jgi:hypothetical protein
MEEIQSSSGARPRIRIRGDGNEILLDPTPELLELLELAAMIGDAAEGDVGFDCAFRPLLLACIYARRGVCEWLDGYVSANHVKREEILRYGTLRGEAVVVQRLARQVSGRLTTRSELRATASAMTWLSAARAFAVEEDRYAWVGLRHLMGALVFAPVHREELESWGFEMGPLEEGYLKYVAEHLPDDRFFWERVQAKSRGRELPGDAAKRREATPSTSELELSDDALEPHVGHALRLAAALAGSQPITSLLVVQAALCLAPEADSPAFSCLADWVQVPLPSELPAQATSTPGPERLSPSLRQLLSWNQQQKRATSQSVVIWGRDLLTAALLSSDRELAATFELLEVARDRWYGFLTAEGASRSKDDWAAWWHEAGVKLPGPGRVAYATETDEGEDQLGVEAEAAAFARLIIDREVKAPLSIGLLGDWGSGKSFFIERIKKQIALLRERPTPELFQHVVEIEFNAWHASDSNLWASLVTHIFDEIWDKISPKSGEVSIARKQLVHEIQQARGAIHEAEQQVEVARGALATAEHDLKRRRQQLAWTTYADSAISQTGLDELVKASGWHEPLETINDVEDAARQLARSGVRLRVALTALLEHPERYVLLPAAVVTALAGCVWLAVDHAKLTEGFKLVGKWLTVVAGAASVFLAPLRTARSKTAKLTEKLGQIRTDYEKRLARAAPEQQQAVAESRRELESAKVSVDMAKARLAELLNQEATLDPRRRLSAFLQERVQSTVYRSQQGIISLVYKDFQQLSTYMKDLRDAPPAASTTHDASLKLETTIRPFERIVIYVDDLDRCRPDQVVHMLEAVHLLLALDLFVVVVAVDARWLTRALEVHYRDLLASESERDLDGLRASTPQNYLEKIFQVTYALGPMDPDHFVTYVRSLAGPQQRRENGEDHGAPSNSDIDEHASHDGAPSPSTVADAHQLRNGGPDRNAATAGRHVAQGVEDRAAAAGSLNAPGPTKKLPVAKAVHIDDAEQELICKVVPLLPTPRIAKRLVNVYRIIKSKKGAKELRAFEQHGRSESCLFMLALLFGRPALAASLLQRLHQGQAPFTDPTEIFSSALERHVRTLPATTTEPQRAQWQALAILLKDMALPVTVGACAREPVEIARYSLVSGHDWHTWPRSSVKTDATRGQTMAA